MRILEIMPRLSALVVVHGLVLFVKVRWATHVRCSAFLHMHSASVESLLFFFLHRITFKPLPLVSVSL